MRFTTPIKKDPQSGPGGEGRKIRIEKENGGKGIEPVKTSHPRGDACGTSTMPWSAIKRMQNIRRIFSVSTLSSIAELTIPTWS